MKKFKKHKIRNTVTVLLLMVCCIGGAELAVAYWLDRPGFDKLTKPGIQKAEQLWQRGSEVIAVGRFWLADKFAQITLAEQEPVDPQKASDPMLADGGEPITDPSVTELTRREGQELLTGGSISIAYYAQSDAAWKDKSYGNDPIGSYGCGPTVMAMAVQSMTGTKTDPEKMSAWCAAHGYWAPKSGSYHSIVQGAATAFGLECNPAGALSADELRLQLSGGRIAVALMKAGHFTSGGHFILLRGITVEGKILVADPNSRARSLAAWDAQTIIDELSDSRSAGAPLWFLSRAVQD